MKSSLILLFLFGFVAFTIAAPVAEEAEDDPEPKAFEEEDPGNYTKHFYSSK